jgi:hypothetical protein
MKCSAAHRWLVVAIATLAIVFGPFNEATSLVTAPSTIMGEMSDGMPCCPNGQPVTPDCEKACQLLVACTPNFVSGLPFKSPASFEFLMARSLDKPSSDFLDRPIGMKPPARPPRT